LGGKLFRLPRSPSSVKVMVLDFATVLESNFGALRTTRPRCSTTGGGRVGSDGFLILSEEGDAGRLIGTAVSDESPCNTSRLARPGGTSNGVRAGRGGFLIPSPVILTLEGGDVGRPTKATFLGEGCEIEGAGFKSL
jgi:hypothetical protein